jgi:hypothetical protein
MSTRTPALAAERAARWVPEHPKALCEDFKPQPQPAEFWCVNCGWNQPLHDDKNVRAAIAAELARLASAGDAR